MDPPGVKQIVRFRFSGVEMNAHAAHGLGRNRRAVGCELDHVVGGSLVDHRVDRT